MKRLGVSFAAAILAGCASVPMGTARSALTIALAETEELLRRAGPGRGEFFMPGGKRVICGGKGCILRWRTQSGLFDRDRATGTTVEVLGRVSLSIEDLRKLRKILLRSRKQPVVIQDGGWRLACRSALCELDVPYPLRSSDKLPSEKQTGEALRGLVGMSDAP